MSPHQNPKSIKRFETDSKNRVDGGTLRAPTNSRAEEDLMGVHLRDSLSSALMQEKAEWRKRMGVRGQEFDAVGGDPLCDKVRAPFAVLDKKLIDSSGDAFASNMMVAGPLKVQKATPRSRSPRASRKPTREHEKMNKRGLLWGMRR